MICLDVETTGVTIDDSIVSIAFYNGDKYVSYGINHPESELTEKEALDKTQRIIDKCKVIVNHNTKFDIKMLIKSGINFDRKPLLICTQVLEWLISGHRNKMSSLNELAFKYLNETKVEGLDFKTKRADQYPLDLLLKYNRMDTTLPYDLYNDHFKGKVSFELIKFYSDLTYFLIELELNGMYVDEDKLSCLHESTVEEIDSLEKHLNSLLEYPINTSSTQQLSCALFGGVYEKDGLELVGKQLKSGERRVYTRKCKIPVRLKGLGFGTSKLELNKNGYYPTDKDTILSLKGRTKKAKEYIEYYKRWNKVKTLYDKFFKVYVTHSNFGFIHANFNMCNTLTGRLSCNEPNIQQQFRPDESLPNPKSVFTSRFGNLGVILEVDFSGAEWRHAADRSKCKQMIQDIVDGKDAHTVTASGFHGIDYDEVTSEQRQDAKPINFRFLYGGSAVGFYLSGLVNSKKEGQKYIDGIYKRYQGLKRSHDKDKALASSTGKLVMPTGRWYDYSGDNYKDSKVLNYPNQGSSSDMTLVCNMVAYDLVKKAKLEAVPINTVHDCLIFDCKNREVACKVNDIVRNIFNEAPKYVLTYFKNYNITVPIESESEIGFNWGEMRELH